MRIEKKPEDALNEVQLKMDKELKRINKYKKLRAES